MPDYFASDVHLRLDRPRRDRRFADWVDGLGADAGLYLAGDVCDFWFAARQARDRRRRSAGLDALRRHVDRGGGLTILPGNHDHWLVPFYRDEIGATTVEEPFEVVSYGLRLRLVHGHLLGARSGWKARMEGQSFLDRFAALPFPLAVGLEWGLGGVNGLRRGASDRRHLAMYRRYAEERPDPPDILALGHIHQTLDETRPNGVRMIVLGSWHREPCFLRVDDDGATLVGTPGRRSD